MSRNKQRYQTPSFEQTPDPVTEKQRDAPVVEPKETEETKRKRYRVVGPGSVRADGKTHQIGSTVELTDADAYTLGDAVSEGDKPEPADTNKRAAGKYRVADGHSVRLGGRTYGPGETLELSEQDARSLGKSLTTT